MRIITHKDTTPKVASIGVYDGVHIGHHAVLSELSTVARSRGVESCVITFDRHPLEVVRPDFHPMMLTTLEEKTLFLSKTGIDCLYVLPFDKTMASLSAKDFMKTILRDTLGVTTLIIGYDNHFGKKSNETFGDYVNYGQELGIEVIQAKPLAIDGTNVSSTLLRKMVAEGDVFNATTMMGRPYQLTGTVVRGEQIGRSMGFPTANLRIDDNSKIVPRNGVYAVWVRMEGSLTMMQAMLNIGNRPTFGDNGKTIEVNIFHTQDNLYGKKLSVFFHSHLRDEMTFPSKAELRQQLEKDKEDVVTALTDNDGSPLLRLV